MPTEDAPAYYGKIAQILSENGFAWIVSQVESEIEQGRSVVKDVQAPEIGALVESETFARRTPRKRRAALLTTIPYTDSERLDILLNAVDTAIAGRASFQEAALEYLPDVVSIEFTPDTETSLYESVRSKRHGFGRDAAASSSIVRRLIQETIGLIRQDVYGRS